jgi:hypothetical protein
MLSLAANAIEKRKPQTSVSEPTSHDDDWEIVPEGMQDGGRLRPQQHQQQHEYDHEHQHEHIIFRKQFDINLGWGDWKHKLMSVDWKQYYKIPAGECPEQAEGTVKQKEQTETIGEDQNKGEKKEIKEKP